MHKFGALLLVMLLSFCSGLWTQRRMDQAALSGDGIVEEFTHHYVESDQGRPFSPTFLGVPAWQNPCDLWVMQEILTETRPEVVVETGTASGGSALFYAWVLEALGIDGKVLTIDLEPASEAAREHPLFRSRVIQILGDSVAAETLARVKEHCRGKRVLVTLDSLHTAAHVAKEIELYAELVTPGSYLVVQDTVIDRHPEWIERYASSGGSTEGPAVALTEFLASDRNAGRFEADRTREKFLFTFHPGGFLRRAR